MGPLVHRPVGHVDAVEQHLTFGRGDHAAGHAKCGGLTGTVGTKQTNDFPALDVQVDTIDDAASTVNLG